MPTLMLPVYKDDPNAGDWLTGFDVFVIEMPPVLARAYLNIMDTVAQTAAVLKLHGMDLYQFRCWDYSGEWFAGDFDADPIPGGEYGNECQPPMPGAEPSRTELNIVLISADSMEWTASPKHADLTVSTGSISRKWLEQIAATAPVLTPARIEADVLTRLRTAAGDDPDDQNRLEEFIVNAGFTPRQTVPCKFCDEQVAADTAHLHDGSWVGDDCCWDERLRSTE